MNVDLPLIVVNPKSGKGLSERKWASMADVIRRNLGPFECRFTAGSGDAVKIAAEEAYAGRKLIVSVGGDGTISELANGIIESGKETELGSLPGGTGSDYRRSLGLPEGLADSARVIKVGKRRLVDAGKLSYVDSGGRQVQRYFINTASFGMSGRVASRANRSTKILGGTLTYATATIQTLFTYDFPELTLQWDEHPEQRFKVITACAAIGPSFGGGMKIAPDARPDDGLFDVTIIGNMSPSRILLSSYKLYSGGIRTVRNTALLRAKTFSAAPVNPQLEVLLEVDGETPGRLPATMEIVPSALRVRV